MSDIAPAAAQALILGGGEVAFLDVREAGQFGEGHPLFAIPAPYGSLEATVPALVPRPAVPVVLIDAGDGVAARAAHRLAGLGYGDVRVVVGGVQGWEAAGLPLYKGVNVPSKVLGELAEAVWHPPMMTPQTLAEWQAEGRPMAFYDVRPPAEYAKMRVPGAVCLPNGELAHRLDVAAPPGVPLVITCAGRTRGIIGAIGLRLAGHEGPYFALENGTQGWALSGQRLERDNTPGPFPELPPAAMAAARARADRVIARVGLAEADGAGAAAMLHDTGRTSFLLDVRSASEAEADPIAAARHALSGQIVQATDQWVGVRGARLILLDDSGLRAAIAGFWLKQMGYEPVVVRLDADPANPLRRLPPPAAPEAPPVEIVGAAEALAAVADGALLLDLRPSMAFRAGHVEGAVWATRARLPHVAGRRVLLVGPQAAFAAQDVAEAGALHVAVVAGGHGALVAAGATVVVTPENPSDAEAIDFLFFVHDRHDGNLDSSRRYLEWETGLVAALTPAERAAYVLLGPDMVG